MLSQGMNIPANLSRRSLHVMIGSMIVAAASLAASAYFFSGFLGGGRSPMGVFQSFILCFGIGALLYLPAITAFFMARHVRGYGAKRSIGLAAMLISLPLWGYGGISLVLRLPYWPYGLAAMCFGLGLLFWAVSVLRNCKANNSA